MLLQVYLHFPFCKSKCQYCDFCSATPKEGEMEAYCDALIMEIEREAPLYRDFSVDTVFLGGGTPSIVPPAMMDRVLAALRSHFAIQKDAEFTTEANPGMLSDDFLAVAVARGVNRVSLGMQAGQDRLLRLIGRIHSVDQVASSVLKARGAGIRNLNLDVMYALPTQTAKEYLDTLKAAVSLGADHISAYSLIVEEGTPLAVKVARGEWLLPSEEAVDVMDSEGRAYLAKRGYERYEISNYARAGMACRHNLGYWQGKYYLGMGVAAHSMLPPLSGGCYDRKSNVSSLSDYITALKSGQSPLALRQAVMHDEAMFESMMLGLRTIAGVDADHFRARYGVSPQEQYSDALDSLVRDGLATVTPRRIALTPRGLDVQNEALLRLMP